MSDLHPPWAPWRATGPDDLASGPAWQRLRLHWHVYRRDTGNEAEPSTGPERHSLVEHCVRDYPLAASIASPDEAARYVENLLATVRASADPDAEPDSPDGRLIAHLDDWYARCPDDVRECLTHADDHLAWYPRKLAPVTPSSTTWSTSLTARVYFHPVKGDHTTCRACAPVRG